MKSFKNILIAFLFIIGYAFSTQVVAGQTSSSPSWSTEELVVQGSVDQKDCGMNWSWD